MKTFKLDRSGDVVIKDNEIEYVEDIELIAQTIRQVLNTNIGEWLGDKTEGIDYSVILTKNPNYDLIRDTINTAVQQVAESLDITLDTDNFEFAVIERKMKISFDITVNQTEQASLEVTL